MGTDQGKTTSTICSSNDDGDELGDGLGVGLGATVRDTVGAGRGWTRSPRPDASACSSAANTGVGDTDTTGEGLGDTTTTGYGDGTTRSAAANASFRCLDRTPIRSACHATMYNATNSTATKPATPTP